ncbi:MAG: SCO family protein [Bacteroidetes bacterium]|nr:SCO family protein [Bacteroidota bacterium]
MKAISKYVLIALIPIAFTLFYFLKTKQNKPIRELPYFGPKSYSKTSDTTYHTIPEFTFTNQHNKSFTDKQLNGKIYITEYFFTTCKSICPIMNTNLQKVYQTFYNDTSIYIVSHTVDPETDSVNVLKEYAQLHNVKNNQWQFLTGNKVDLYAIARKGYLLNTEEGNGGEEDFIHTQNFALIDKEKRIRGFYDGTDTAEINRLIIDVKLLKQHYEYIKN